jgi:DNA primase
LINWDSTIYLVEGVFEMFSFPVNIVPMLGKDLSDALFHKLKAHKPEVVILLDPDAYKSSIDLFYKLHAIYVGEEERVRIVKLPTNEDLDELRRSQGHEAVIKALYSARGLTTDDYFISRLHKPYEKQRRRYNSYKQYFGG